MSKCTIGVVAVLLGWAGPALADTYIETFDGAPAGDWRVNGAQQIQPAGGNPGAFLYGFQIDSIFPRVWTGLAATPIFLGDFRARQVSSLGLDADLIRVDFPNVGDRPMTLLLVNDSGTPGDPDDDWAAFTRGANIPFLEEGWKSYDYAIPYSSAVLPANWQFLQLGPNAPTPDWNQLITNVSGVQFWWGDPDLFYIFQMWEIGVDNVRITYIPEPATAALLAGLAVLVLRRR